MVNLRINDLFVGGSVIRIGWPLKSGEIAQDLHFLQRNSVGRKSKKRLRTVSVSFGPSTFFLPIFIAVSVSHAKVPSKPAPMPMLPFWLPTGPTAQLPTTLPTGAPLLPQDFFPATATHLKAMQRVTSRKKDRETAGLQTIFSPSKCRIKVCSSNLEEYHVFICWAPSHYFFTPDT